MSRTATRPPVTPAGRSIAPRADDAALPFPPGHVGPVALPGTGRMVWWTGRVAIGLRHQASSGTAQAVSSSALWIQSLLLGARRRTLAG